MFEHSDMSGCVIIKSESDHSDQSQIDQRQDDHRECDADDQKPISHGRPNGFDFSSERSQDLSWGQLGLRGSDYNRGSVSNRFDGFGRQLGDPRPGLRSIGKSVDIPLIVRREAWSVERPLGRSCQDRGKMCVVGELNLAGVGCGNRECGFTLGATDALARSFLGCFQLLRAIWASYFDRHDPPSLIEAQPPRLKTSRSGRLNLISSESPINRRDRSR